MASSKFTEHIEDIPKSTSHHLDASLEDILVETANHAVQDSRSSSWEQLDFERVGDATEAFRNYQDASATINNQKQVPEWMKQLFTEDSHLEEY
ncbi:MAG: hypothetical protein M1835_008176 [Candelina submexicana]|nr:MAG: hypothetical protein M1835_008176 [Candelina submexicana]